MITIQDADNPIEVASKIIYATKPYQSKIYADGIVETVETDETIDMFDLNEIKEIASYLQLFYELHKNKGGAL